MFRKFVYYLAILTIGLSILLPLLFLNDLKGFSENLFMALLSVIAVVATLFGALYYIAHRQIKGSIYIAEDFSDMEFVRDLKEQLNRNGYICYPDLSALLSGKKIRELNLNNQIQKSEMLVVVLSEDTTDSDYISYIAKAFKKESKPIQIFSLGVLDVVPSSLKSYMMFPLSGDKKNKLSLIIQYVDSYFRAKNLSNK